MISIEAIRGFYPAVLSNNPVYYKYLLKEYIQLQVLDYLSNTPYARKLALIGGTNLRLVSGIDRFSEDLDFDCKDLAGNEFIQMSDDILQYLKKNGLNVITRDRESEKLNAWRRSYYFPGFLFDLGLSGHKEEKFLIKVEAEDQEVNYKKEIVNIKSCGFFFSFPVPSEATLSAMKIAAMLNRQKGRDFYDVMFLFGRASPDYSFLKAKAGISTLEELKRSTEKMLMTTDLKKKMKDFDHLLFNRENSRRILQFGEFIREL